MRLFVCTLLSTENQQFYSRRMADLIASSGGILRGVPPESVHITHAFLEQVDDSGLRQAIETVRDLASRQGAFDIRLGVPFILYARAEARLVAAPVVAGDAAVLRLGMDIVRELERRMPGVRVSGSRSPHVTLGRFRRNTSRRAAAGVAGLTRSLDASNERDDRAAAVQVVSSELTSAGPRYEIKASVSLRGDAPL